MTGSRAILRVLTGLFIAACLFWVIWTPRDSMAVFRCIPADVAVVTVHDNLADRWDSVRNSAVFEAVVASDTGAVAQLDAAFADPGFSKWFNRLAARRTVIAWSPGGGGRRSAWYFASSIGGISRGMRLMAEARLARDLKPGSECRGDRVWNLSAKELGRGRRLSIILEDGFLMGCISADSNGVARMANAYNSRKVGQDRLPVGSIVSLEARSGVSALWEGTAPDRGWLNFANLPASYGLEIDENSERGCAGRFWTGDFTGAGLPVFRQADFDELACIVGSAPQAMCIAPIRSVAFGVEYVRSPAWLRDVTDLMETASGDSTNGSFFACLLGAEYSGRLKSVIPPDFADVLTNGIAVPVVLCGVKVVDVDKAAELCSALPAKLNKFQKMNLFMEQGNVNGCKTLVFRSAVTNDYGKLAAGECFALAVCGNWLLGSSNADTLGKILERRQNTSPGRSVIPPEWQKTLPREGASYHVWADLAAGGLSVQNGIALWKMSLGEGVSARRLKESLVEAMSWAERIGKLKLLVADGGKAEAGGIEVRFRIGEQNHGNTNGGL